MLTFLDFDLTGLLWSKFAKGINMGKLIKLKRTTKTKENLKFNSFFAGIGGFDIGLEAAGLSAAFHCEINDFCLSVLKRHWPNVAKAKDIKCLLPEDLPDADVWCGGFPCQDVSVARGSLVRDGLKGRNSGLFFQILELIKARRPRVVLLENVTGLLNSHGGKDFLKIVSSLTELGYGVAWRIMNARYFGAPQSRPRVFICAWQDRVDLALHALYEKASGTKVNNERKAFLTPTKCLTTGATVPSISYCLAATSGRHTGTDWSRTYVAYFDKVRRLTPVECEGLQGFAPGWSLPEKDYPLCDDEIDTLRYHAIGNAVSVPVIKWIGNRIAAVFSGKTGDLKAEMSSNVYLKEHANKDFADLQSSGAGELNRIADKNGMFKWQSGGAAFSDLYIDAKVSPAPCKVIEKKLIEVIEKRTVENHYFLSSNAAQGILRRVNKQGRTLFQPLQEALARLATTKTTNRTFALNKTVLRAG